MSTVNTKTPSDEAINQVLTKVKSVSDAKQDKLTGASGNVVQFDASGNPIAVDPTTMLSNVGVTANHTHDLANGTTAGFSTNDYTTADKNKLTGIEPEANKTTLPIAATDVTPDATHRFVTDTQITDWNSKAAGDHTHSEYYLKTETYSKDEADTAIANATTSATAAAYSMLRSEEVYSFIVNQSETEPSQMITYGGDATGFAPASMDFSSGTFSFGSWDSTFIADIRPVLLGFNGEIIKELDPTNFALDIDGNPVDISSDSVQGNVMIAIPKVYWKTNKIDEDNCQVLFSRKKCDANMHAWSHIDYADNEADMLYISAYPATLVDGKLRSLSGKAPSTNHKLVDDLGFAAANDVDSTKPHWGLFTYSDWQLLNFLTYAMAKSTDPRSVFGMGNAVTGTRLNSGVLNDKGMFYGYNDTTHAVKLFGIENLWGNICHQIAGFYDDARIATVKMCNSKYDGSNHVGYNPLNGGFINTHLTMFANTGWLSAMDFTQYGFIPMTLNGSATTKYCDECKFGDGIKATVVGDGGPMSVDTTMNVIDSSANVGNFITYR